MGRWETPYLKARIGFEGNYSKDTPLARKEPFLKFDNYRDSFVFKNMQIAYGPLAADAVLCHISVTVGKARQDIVSSYATFCKYVKEVYGEEHARNFLSKIPSTF
ncbi:MAG TPA: hypothetical protein VLC72_00415 [Nitrosopumilaceae archaeon]|nr:hypothetical protein [Nitrosopumilaceae archaeon]